MSDNDNVGADVLSRTEEVQAAVDYKALEEAQRHHVELESFLGGNASLQLKLLRVSGTDVSLFCDVSTATAHSFVPLLSRPSLSNYSNSSGAKAIANLVT